MRGTTIRAVRTTSPIAPATRIQPFNGLFMILVYSRPHVKALRSRNQDLTFLEAFVTVFKAGADNDLGESLHCVDEEGIDVPRLPEAER